MPRSGPSVATTRSSVGADRKLLKGRLSGPSPEALCREATKRSADDSPLSKTTQRQDKREAKEKKRGKSQPSSRWRKTGERLTRDRSRIALKKSVWKVGSWEDMGRGKRLPRKGRPTEGSPCREAGCWMKNEILVRQHTSHAKNGGARQTNV